MNEIDLIFKDLYQKMPKTFDLNVSNSVSSILLFKDYISKLKDYKILLFNEYQTFGLSLNLEYNNLILDFNNNLRSEILPYMDFRNYLYENYQINLLSGRYFNGFFIYLFIYWEVYKNELTLDGNISNPYYGLIKLFRNDCIHRYEGINVSNITMRSSSMNLKLPSIEDDFLAYIDSKCKLIGSAGIPNQEKVNELWEEFKSLNKNE